MRTIGSGPKGFAHVAQQLLNRPLAIDEHKAEVILCAVQQRLGIVSMTTIDGITLDAKAMLDKGALARDAVRDRDNGKTYHVDGNIAVIPIDGTLVHKFGWLDPMSGMTGYDGLSRKLTDAMRDDDVLGIWLDIDSPGGSVAGLMEFVAELAGSTKRAGRGGKPIYAWVGETACSAAYAIACVCDKVYAPRDGISASIGTVAVHTSIACALDEAGIKVTVFRSGPRKYRGNQYEPLDDETAKKLQDSVDLAGRRFCALVAMMRNVPLKDVIALGGDWFGGDDLVRLGLVDAILTEREAWSRLEEECDAIKRERRTAR